MTSIEDLLLIIKEQSIKIDFLMKENAYLRRRIEDLEKPRKESGIGGLHTRPGQGRKPIMDCSDEEAVRKAIELDRQSVSAAKEEWQKASGKEASDLTFRRFLPALVQDISE